LTHRYSSLIIGNMPARYTPLVTNHFYHVFNRGINSEPIFLDKKHFTRALNLLHFYNYVDYPVRFSKFLLLSNDRRKEIWKRLEKSTKHTEIISYCLMPNHFHLLLKQRIDHGISKFIANFQNSYAKYCNLKNNRTGHLFQGQFKAVLINTEEQLLHVHRYIHLNPYSAGLVAKLENLEIYPWSSFHEYLKSDLFNFTNQEDILSNFKKPDTYKKFILDQADYQKSLEYIKHLALE